MGEIGDPESEGVEQPLESVQQGAMVQMVDAPGKDGGWHPQRHTCADGLIPTLCALRIRWENPVARVACAADERLVILAK